MEDQFLILFLPLSPYLPRNVAY